MKAAKLNIGSLIRKYFSISALFILLLLAGESKAVIITGYAYYTDMKTDVQYQIPYGHYTLQFIWIDPSNSSVHVMAGGGSNNPLYYALDGSYWTEVSDEDGELDFIAIIFPNDEKEDDFYASYHPMALDIANATTFIPNQVETFSPNGVGKEIIERPSGIMSGLSGNIFFDHKNIISPIVSIYNNNELVNSVAANGNSYQFSVPPGNYEIKFSCPGYSTKTYTADVPVGSKMFLNANMQRSSKDLLSIKPEKYSLQQNYPNPFNPTTNISFSLPKNSNVTLKIFNSAGKEVARLIDNEFRAANNYAVQFDASGLPSGIYFYSLETQNYKDTKKMMLIK